MWGKCRPLVYVYADVSGTGRRGKCRPLVYADGASAELSCTCTWGTGGRGQVQICRVRGLSDCLAICLADVTLLVADLHLNEWCATWRKCAPKHKDSLTHFDLHTVGWRFEVRV